jgi:hypothetical protein
VLPLDLSSLAFVRVIVVICFLDLGIRSLTYERFGLDSVCTLEHELELMLPCETVKDRNGDQIEGE